MLMAPVMHTDCTNARVNGTNAYVYVCAVLFGGTLYFARNRKKVRKEYEDIPPEPHYRDGYNLYRRMEKYMENHLLFLKEPGVPSTNNEAERRLRPYKRKQAQAVTFRSFESLDQLCQCMSMLVMMREKEGQNIFQKVCGIFG